MSINTPLVVPLIVSMHSDKMPSAPETSNLNLFNSFLNAPSAKDPYNAAPDNLLANPLSQRSELLQALSNKAARALQKVSNSTDPIDMINSTRAMSNSHFATVLSAKIISKATQGIEKLTNLS